MGVISFINNYRGCLMKRYDESSQVDNIKKTKCYFCEIFEIFWNFQFFFEIFEIFENFGSLCSFSSSSQNTMATTEMKIGDKTHFPCPSARLINNINYNAV